MPNMQNLQVGTIDSKSTDARDRYILGHTKAVDRSARTVEGVASTINLDRDGEIILPGAFKARMGKFLDGNAPFLAAHTHRSDDGSPTQIGWVMAAALSKSDVTAKFRFALTDLADEWWKLASDPSGKGIAFSIGFIPIRWVFGSSLDLGREFPAIKPILAASGYSDEDKLRVYTEIELLEISGVPVPSNREALQILAAKAAGRDADKAIDEFAGLIAAKVIAAWSAAMPAGEVLEVLEAGDQETDMKTLRAEMLDAIAEVRELIQLSPEMAGLDTRRLDAPDADDDGAAAGDGDKGATEKSQIRTAAESLLKTCV